MTWYTASLLFKSEGDASPPNDCLWEERIVLLEATSVEEAEEKARRLGAGERFRYESAGGEQVTWMFDRIERTCAVDAAKLIDGTELFSRFLRASEVASLVEPFPDER